LISLSSLSSPTRWSIMAVLRRWFSAKRSCPIDGETIQFPSFDFWTIVPLRRRWDSHRSPNVAVGLKVSPF
jgi:hypothetical protein